MKKIGINDARPALLGNPILQELAKLEVGESLTFEKSEWKPKSAPVRLICARFGSGNFSTVALADKSGWCVTRIK